MMSDSIPEDDDHLILSILTQPQSTNANASHDLRSLSQNDFTKVHNRLIADITSPVSGISNGKFWQEVVSKTSSLGFTFQPDKDSTSRANISSSGETFPAPFDTERGKQHLAATSALLGVTQSEAMRLTNNISCLKKEKQRGSGSGQRGTQSNDAQSDLQKLIGTKQLLLLVRDYHYAQAISRVRIITEAIRLECAYEDDDSDKQETEASTKSNKKHHQDLCIAFLNGIDGQDTWTSSSRGNHDPRERGLFRLLISQACAPVRMVGREEIYRACELSDNVKHSESEASAGTQTVYSSASPEFARELVAEHFAHTDLAMRTEALEALFVLFYQRIDGGIDRGEYVLLLQALSAHAFFADSANDDNGSGGGNKRSQLTSLILAECMGLWRTASKSVEDGNESWVDFHPFLCNPSSAQNEVEIIGKILVNDLAKLVLERRRICMMQSVTGDENDDKIEVPEAVALLTFGLLMKLSHSCAQTGKWASDMKVKVLALDCVSMANDECGAFGYLRHIMSCLLTSSSAKDALELGDAVIGLDQVCDYSAIMLNGKNQSRAEESPLKITNGETGDLNQSTESAGEESSSVVYASIGREILVATLSAFRSSLSRSLSSSKVDNLGMFCHLASNIHHNSDDLCQKFWVDWEATPQGMNLSENSVISADEADPLVYLLDIAHSVAIDALATLGNELSREQLISADCGRQEAAILPCLSPLLGMLASLIPRNGDGAAAIIKTFIPNGMVLACLRGVYHICSEGNSWSGVEGENNRRVEAARKCMESVRILSSIATKENNKDCADWLRQATQCETPTSNLYGASLLYYIAEAANDNPAMLKSMSLDITSDALYTTAYLCCPGNCDQEWIMKVGQSFSSVRDDGFRLFAAHINEVTVSFTFLLRQLSLCVTDVTLATENLSLDSILGFMSMSKNGTLLACDIISSSPQLLDLSGSHRCILMNAFNTVASTLRIVNGIASCHRDENVRDTAFTIRNDIVNALATSTSLGSNIGFFATMPVLKQIAEIGSSEAGVFNSSPLSLTATKSNAEEKKEGNFNSLPIEDLSSPTKYEENVITLSRAAMSLLKAWSDVVEKIAIERIDISVNMTSVDSVAKSLPAPQRASMASFLLSLGPSRLLFSSAPRPAEPGTTLFALIARITSWFVEGAHNVTNTLGDTAIIAIELMTSALLHGKLEGSNEEFSSFSTSFELSTHSVGIQLHKVLSLLIDAPVESICKKRSLVMLRTLEFLRSSISHHPSLGNLILQGPTNEDSLVMVMLDKVNMQDFNSHRDAIIASSCLQVFLQLWESCRSHCSDSPRLQSLRSIHPSDDVVRTLVKSKRLIKQMISILDKFSALVHESHGELDLDEIAIYHRCTLLNILCYATKVIEVDASFYLRNINYDSNAESIIFLNKIGGDNRIVEWLKAIKKYDGILATVRSSENFNNVLQVSRTVLSPIALNDVSATMLLLKNQVPASIYQTLAPFDASCHLLASQSNLAFSVSTLGELMLSAVQQDSSNGDKMIRLAVQLVNNLFVVAENGLAAYSQTVSAAYSVPVSQTVICGDVFLNFVLSCISKLTNPEVTKEVLVILIDKLLRSSERLLVLTESAHDDASLNTELRLNTATCAISLINVMMDCTDSTLSYEASQLWKTTRLGLCQFSSETLSKIKCSKREGNFKDASHQLYSYGTQTARSAIAQKHNVTELNALHSSISLLTTVATISSKENQDRSLSQQSFHLDLADTLRSSRTLELLSAHMEMASDSASKSYRQKGKVAYEEAAFETVQRILSFASVLCDDRGSILSELVASGKFIQLILNNSILRAACENWTMSGRHATSMDQDVRGYLETPESGISFASRSHPNMTKDPVHEIWRATLQTIAGLLHATNEEVSEISARTKTREHAANIAIDFLHFSEIPITSFIEQFLTPRQQESSTVSTPSSGLSFTAATMGELSDILALVSELCSEEHGKQFESSAPRLYKIMSTAALAVCRSLSLFLGALGTAREIFTVLNCLNDVMGKDMNQSTSAMQYQSSSNHPLLADGVNNAKHQAIRNALYASSCCSCITPDEYALSPLGQPKNNQKTPVDLEHAFHSHVSNDFIYHMEDTASQCMVSALSIIHQMHPSTSAFVVFSDHEAAQLNLSSAPPIGAIVAIRSGSGSQIAEQFLCPSVTIRYGRVTHYNAIARNFDVEYFDKLGLPAERHVNLSRLAALEDVSKRVKMFNYKPAPESVCDNPANFTTDASIGNLILILRWCKQQASAKDSSTNGDRSSLQVKAVASLSSILLGNELSIHLDLGSPTFATEQEGKSINNQLLSLFDDEVSLQNFDLSASTASATKCSALEDVIEKEVWTSVQSQLESSLIAARADRDIAMRNAAEQGGATQYWARTPQSPHTRSNRRSPFF